MDDKGEALDRLIIECRNVLEYEGCIQEDRFNNILRMIGEED